MSKPRTGVCICECGTNIADVVDVPAVVNMAPWVLAWCRTDLLFRT